MADFTLDTSGAVAAPGGSELNRLLNASQCLWSDISPFEQGYVEGLLRDFWEGLQKVRHFDTAARLGFSSLHHETLAAIRKDCDGVLGTVPGFSRTDLSLDPASGADFWRLRQNGVYPAFPPLTPFLDDEGKVRLREAHT